MFQHVEDAVEPQMLNATLAVVWRHSETQMFRTTLENMNNEICIDVDSRLLENGKTQKRRGKKEEG